MENETAWTAAPKRPATPLTPRATRPAAAAAAAAIEAWRAVASAAGKWAAAATRAWKSYRWPVQSRWDAPSGEFVVRVRGRAVVGAASVAAAALVLGVFFHATPTAPSTVTPTVLATAVNVPAKSDFSRTVGLNYVVVQTCDTEAEANRDRERLARKEIFCTVERGLPGFAAKNVYCVVGLQGFTAVRHSKDYEKYVAGIKALHFEPQPYKWRRADAAMATARIE